MTLLNMREITKKMKQSNQPPQSTHTHEDAPRRRLKPKVEYLCHLCGKWYTESKYSIKNYMCKNCLKKVGNSSLKSK